VLRVELEFNVLEASENEDFEGIRRAPEQKPNVKASRRRA
jgi:hypothetical protein